MFRLPIHAALFAAAGAIVALVTATAAPASAGAFGQHVSTCAQTHGFDADMNPGMHHGITGWDPSHVC